MYRSRQIYSGHEIYGELSTVATAHEAARTSYPFILREYPNRPSLSSIESIHLRALDASLLEDCHKDAVRSTSPD